MVEIATIRLYDHSHNFFLVCFPKNSYMQYLCLTKTHTLKNAPFNQTQKHKHTTPKRI